MLYELVHYLESTGDDFGLICDSRDEGADVGPGVSARCCLLVESESGHCVVLKSGGAVALLEAEYAPDDWWDALSQASVELIGFAERGESVRLSAGRYLFGDVHALRNDPSSNSSLASPAACVSIEWTASVEAIPVELDVNAQTRLVGFLLGPTLDGTPD